MVVKKNQKKFLEAFETIPETQLHDLCAIVYGRCFTWQQAAVEVRKSSEYGKSILDFMDRLHML